MTITMAQAMESFETRIKPKPPEKETIHSGHFMVSDFEAEAQDDEDDVAVPVPDSLLNKANMNLQAVKSVTNATFTNTTSSKSLKVVGQNLAIETSLTKLFQCMSLAYRQKLTSPKWNRFKGIKLRWKDKIRLNNVIWRCWHMQFITKKNSLVCQFASPLDVDTHNKPEAVVLEGKYWKRKLNAVTAEYKKWRMFYRNQILGWAPKDGQDMLSEMDLLDWQPHSNESTDMMMVDEDYMEFMSDTLFSTISAQPFAFPDTREIARGASLADFIQPSLVQLQPNLDDFMDTLEPLQELLYTKLPPVPEETSTNTTSDGIQDLYRALGGNYQVMAPEPPPPPPPPPIEPLPMMYQPIKQEPTQYSAPSYQYTAGTANTTSSPTHSSYPNKSSVSGYQPVPYNMTAAQQAPSSSHYQQLSPPSSSSSSNPASVPSPPEFKLPSPPPPPPVYPLTSPRTNIRSNSLPLSDNKPAAQRGRPAEEVFAIPKLKHRNRSRSGSCLVTQGKTPPPLLSAGSDPALNINTSQSSSALLAQLLTASNHANSAAPYSYRGTTNPVTNPVSILDKSNSSGTTGAMISMAGTIEPATSFSYNQNQATAASATTAGSTSAGSSSDQTISDSQSVIYPSHNQSGESGAVCNIMQPVQLLSSGGDTFTFTAGNGSTAANVSRRAGKPQPVAILPQPSTTTLVITTPGSSVALSQQSPQVIGSASNSPKHPDSPSGCEYLSLSPLNMGSPNSPNSKNPGRRTYKEHRRVCHINAEQKRRCTIKNGFDTLHALIPQLNQNPNAKLSKAAMLQKGAEYIRQLRNERNQLKEEMDSLRQQVDCLNSAISNCQSLLPATGAPVSRHRTSKMKEMYYEYVRARTQENWRFWLLSLICEPLLVSFNAAVSTASLDDLYRTTLLWVEQHCSLVDLRPVVLNALRHLCTTTDILADPAKLPSEVQAAAMKTRNGSS